MRRWCRPHQGDRRDQPEQPDGHGVSPRGAHPDRRSSPQARLMLLADEIYDKILYDDAQHIAMASVAPDVLCLTFNGLSKAYRVAGYRSGWLVIACPQEHAESFIEGISLLANIRLGPNVPARHAIKVALGGHQSIEDLVLP